MAELKVLSAGAVQAMMEAIGPEFERASGNKLKIEFATVGALRKRVEAGEHADVVAMSESAIEALDTPGRFVPGSVKNLGQTITGIAVKKGAPRPDVSTAEAFKAALLKARSVSYTDPKGGGSSGVFFGELLKRLGIADEVNRKAVLRGRGYAVAQAIAAGEAEIGTTFISEFLTVPGVEVLGGLPPGLENPNTYTAAVPAASKHPTEAAAFIKALTDPAGRARWKAAGLEPAF